MCVIALVWFGIITRYDLGFGPQRDTAVADVVNRKPDEMVAVEAIAPGSVKYP